MLVHVVSNLFICALRASVIAPPPYLDHRGVKMGQADVEEWVIASTVTNEDLDDTENGGWSTGRILAGWSEGLSIIRANLSSSSTKTRVEFLEGLVILLVKDESEFRASWFTAITILKLWKI